MHACNARSFVRAAPCRGGADGNSVVGGSPRPSWSIDCWLYRLCKDNKTQTRNGSLIFGLLYCVPGTEKTSRSLTSSFALFPSRARSGSDASPCASALRMDWSQRARCLLSRLDSERFVDVEASAEYGSRSRNNSHMYSTTRFVPGFGPVSQDYTTFRVDS